MTRLEDLIYSLATVLVRYHDSQGLTDSLVNEQDELLKAQKSRTLATSIINSDEPTFEAKLRELITKCTIKYPDRQHFLTYLLNELIVLKSIHSRTDVVQKEELPQYEALLFQILQQFKQLLTIKKNATTAIKYSTLPGSASGAADITLNGLINTAYVGSHFCNSGNLLLEEVLNRLNLTDKSSNEEIQSAAQDMVSEYQNKLIADTAARAQQDLLQQLNSLKAKLEQTDIEHLEYIKGLTAELTPYKTLITKLEKDLGTTREENSSLRQENKGQKNIIKELQGKLTALTSESEQIQTPVTSIYDLSLFRTGRNFTFNDEPKKSPTL